MHEDCVVCLEADARSHAFDFLLWRGELDMLGIDTPSGVETISWNEETA